MKCLWAFLGGVLIAVVVVVLTIGLFYAVVDWRGASEWREAQATIKKAGEPVDYQDLTPPPVPDAQNLGALPLFKPNGYPDNALKLALEKIQPPTETLPRTGNWTKGETTDMAAVKAYLSDHYQKAFPGAQVPADTLTQFDALFPALNDLRVAGRTRPLCRFPMDYTTMPPYARPLGPVTQFIKLAKVIDLHAVVALHSGQPALALDDIELLLKIAGGVRREPLLVSGLVAAGLVAIQTDSIWEGLAQHVWTDSQLVELQEQLRQVDFLSNFQLCIRGEAVGFLAPTNAYLREHRADAVGLFFDPMMSLIKSSDGDLLNQHKPPVVARIVMSLVPNGWFDMTNARGVTLYYEMAREESNPARHRVYPDRYAEMERAIDSLSRYNFPDLILRVCAGPISHGTVNFAQAQSHIDAALIACALERYRLAHNAYPASLADLAPYAPHGLPHDLINGEPFRYKLLTDGSYLLYSVGWNQVDDGGTIAHVPGNPNSPDKYHGDWVWPFPKYQPPAETK